MARPSKLFFSSYPLLKQMLFQQVLLGVIGVLFVFSTLYVTTRARHQAAKENLKKSIVSTLSNQQEQLRVWKLMEMHEALDNEIHRLQSLLDLTSLEVVSESDLKKHTSFDIKIPEIYDPVLKYYIVAKLNDKTLPQIIFLPEAHVSLLVGFGVLFFFMFFVCIKFIYSKIYEPLSLLLEKLTLTSTGMERIDFKINSASGEILDFINQIDTLYLKSVQLVQNEQEFEKDREIAKMAAQVAHDIRSPLAALAVVTKNVDKIPDEMRSLVLDSAARIKELSDGLLVRYKSSRTIFQIESRVDCVELVPLIQSIVAEKKILLGKSSLIDIVIDAIGEAASCRAKVNSIEFKRIISNLLSNSIEAISLKGSICISISVVNQAAKLRLSDSGRGMSQEDLKRLLVEGGSFNKANGHGLGLSHARDCLSKWGAKFEMISSSEGTTTIIDFPRLSLADSKEVQLNMSSLEA